MDQYAEEQKRILLYAVHVSEPPSVEDDVDVWRYAIVSCMPETTTSGISEAEITNNKRLRSTFCIEAIQTRSIARSLCDSRASRLLMQPSEVV